MTESNREFPSELRVFETPWIAAQLALIRGIGRKSVSLAQRTDFPFVQSG
jgi:hypothetical protein